MIDYRKLIDLYRNEANAWRSWAAAKQNGFYFKEFPNKSMKGQSYITKFIHVPIHYIEANLRNGIKSYTYNKTLVTA